jgi:hypothetical protein
VLASRLCPETAGPRRSRQIRTFAGDAFEKTHYAASLVSAADQRIPDDDIRVVLEDLITETGR